MSKERTVTFTMDEISAILSVIRRSKDIIFNDYYRQLEDDFIDVEYTLEEIMRKGQG